MINIVPLFRLIAFSLFCILGCTGTGVTNVDQFIQKIKSGSKEIVIQSSFLLTKAVPEITRSLVIRGNTTSCAKLEKGGPCYIHAKYNWRHLKVSKGTVTLKDIELRGGQAVVGGAVYVTGGATLMAVNARFSFNYASGVLQKGGGGAIEADSASKLVISNSLFIRNKASFGGAIELTSGSKATITRTRFHRNTADLAGGAISSFGSSRASIASSTFSVNEAMKGGVMFLSSSNATVCSTVAFNNKAKLLGPVYMSSASSRMSYCKVRVKDFSTEKGGIVAGKCPCSG